MLLLDCSFQSYAWGKRGFESLVKQLKRINTADRDPYAELWIGTHKSGPSKLNASGELLSDWLTSHPAAVGAMPGGEATIPFLFKVLSIQSALSIQAHPDKVLAERLHSQDSKNYPDANHKPEMVIALTTFKCMCGFRPIDEICMLAQQFPEFGELMLANDLEINTLLSGNQKENLRVLFTRYLSSQSYNVEASIQKLFVRLQEKKITAELDEIEVLILDLMAQYPGDIGVFSPLLLNYLVLEPGESFFIGPNEPHAYIFGDCIECMALSDNVVRAGLTPKHKDVGILSEMLSYQSQKPHFITPKQLTKEMILYRPPCAEFEVLKVELNSFSTIDIAALPTASFYLILKGETSISNQQESGRFEKGDCIFVPANTSVSLKSQHCDCLLYRASCNLTALNL